MSSNSSSGRRDRGKGGKPHPSSVSGFFPKRENFSLDPRQTGNKRSDIPNLESDYCPRDEASRRLFYPGPVDLCECECASEGFLGSLHRQKQCILKYAICALSAVLVLFLLVSVTYTLRRSAKGGDSILRTWISHYHNDTSPEGHSGSFQLHEDEKTLDADIQIDVYDDRRSDNPGDRYETVDLNDDRNVEKIEHVFIQSLDALGQDPRNEVFVISDERAPLRLDKRSVRPARDVSIDKYDIFKNGLLDGRLEDKLTSTDEWMDVADNAMEADKERFKANAKTVFEAFSLTTPSGDNPLESLESLETNELDDVDKGMETLEEPTKESEERTNVEGSTNHDESDFDGQSDESNVKNTLMEEKIENVADAKTKEEDVEDPTENLLDKEEQGNPPASILDGHPTTGPGVDDLRDQYTDEPKESDALDDYAASSTGSSTWPESSRMSDNFAPVEAISLAEAIKRRKENRKYLLLNSRVVGGSSDVRLPTGPDVVKPPVNAFETLKTGQQLSFTPSGSSQLLYPYQLCVYANPYVAGKPSIRSAQSRTFPLGTSPLFSSLMDKADPLKQFQRAPTQQNFLTFSVNNYANAPPRQQQSHYPTTGLFHFLPQQLTNAPMPNTQPIFCTYLQPPLFQFPTVPGTADFAHGKSVDFEDDLFRQPIVQDPYFLPGRMTHCPDDAVACRDGSGCIPLRNWCDNQVHCQDVSDEAFCSCRERVVRDRICDGYLDCPRGEDEIGCFGCPRSAFSCDSVISPESCIPLNKRCDGVRDCAIGNDETDCSALFLHVHANNSYQVSYTSGYLHRNWRGDWFPVCVDVKYDEWAKEACLGEIGYLPTTVEVSYASVPDFYKGPFIVRNEDGTPSLQDHCKGHLSTYVKCPAVRCGTRAEFYNLQDFENRFKRLSSPKNRKSTEEGNSKKKREETGRVVGGRESEPRAWPWAVAIYKDGGFLCGGVILDEQWILTAAHCIQQYWKHFYEVRAGMLRRFSFSPMEQVRAVADVIVHENYDPVIMSNDIALLRLQAPFRFNRWVRPGCLPSFRGGISNFFATPPPGTHCTAVGWGALRERGIDADQLREVEVPIMPRCKHKEDVAGAEICAGKAEGGKDTCQGDSGGPLLCKNLQTPLAWYVAGVVSHGEGCARPGEPGAYTRISLFLDWITMNANEFKMPSLKPLGTCPGFRCATGSRLCIPTKWVCNGFTDCLEAEDEKNCTVDFQYGRYFTPENPDGLPKTLQMRITSEASDKMNSTGWDKYDGRTEGKDDKIKNVRVPVRKHQKKSRKEQEAEDSTGRTSVTDHLVPKIGSEIKQGVPENSEDSAENFDEARTGKAKNLQEAAEKYDFSVEGTEPAPSWAKIRATSLDGFPQFVLNEDDLKFTSGESLLVEDVAGDYATLPLRSEIAEDDDEDTAYFQCHDIVQSVLRVYQCDGIRDCEDGTDEADCSCSEVLRRSRPGLLCDGHLDCSDGTDEVNCDRCDKNEFLCKISGECLPLTEKCNGVPKCRFGEDERNCFALTTSEEIKPGPNGDPPLEARGFVHEYKNGRWRKLCQETNQIPDGKVAADVCSDSGWIGYHRYENVSLGPSCMGIEVYCSTSLATSLHHYQVRGEGYLWPWNAFVFCDGRPVCTAVLLQPQWLLTSAACMQNVSLSQNYLAAKLGSKSSDATGTGQQISRIDALRFPTATDLVLLHLEDEINQTRSVRPLGVPYLFESDPDRDICVAIGDGTTFLRLVDNCSESAVCYSRMVSKPLNCRSERWTGVITCQSRVGWYPSSAYTEEDGGCGFVAKEFPSIQDKMNRVQVALAEEVLTVPGAECAGFRCPEGRCIPSGQVCDGVPNCPSKADEDPSTCNDRSRDSECQVSELKCRNGLCRSKMDFADGMDDCGDGSDEPENPTCLEFLRLTDPEKICNGIRNCQDKTDEDPTLCACSEFKFKCHLSNHCVPADFVCDGEKDCPGSEDEEKCLGRRRLDNFKRQAFEIVKKSYGLWHNTCPPTIAADTSDSLCEDLGFEKASRVYLTNQTVLTPQLDPFTWVKLNDRTNLALRSDRPFVRLVKDLKSCYVVKCA